jgi:competence protein ComEC
LLRSYSRLQKRYTSSEIPSLIFAGLLGRRDLLSTPVWEVFKELGLSHVLVISGYHFALLAWLLQHTLGAVIRRSEALLRYMRVSVAAGVLSVAVGWWYFSLLPFAAPIVRAALAFSLLLFTVRQSRRISYTRSMLLVALVMLFLDPVCLIDPGPQLTFAALVGLVLGAHWFQVIRKWRGRERNRQTPIEGVVLAALLSLGASMMTFPIVVWYFGTVVPLSPLSSLLVSPVFSFWILCAGGGLLLLDLCGLPSQVLWNLYIPVGDCGLKVIFAFRDFLDGIGLGVYTLEIESPWRWLCVLSYVPLLVSILPCSCRRVCFSPISQLFLRATVVWRKTQERPVTSA